MPTVPSYDSLTITPNNPEARVSTPEFKNFAPAEGDARGKALMAAGNVTARITADIMETANKVRTAEAINQLTEHGVALQYAKPSTNEDGTRNEGGFVNVVGKDALERKNPDGSLSGRTLSDEYTGRLVAKAAEIEKGLGNDSQRMMFRAQAAELANRFKGIVTAHESKQFTLYNDSVQTGIIKTNQEVILANPLDKDAVDGALVKINNATTAKLLLAGKSTEEIDAEKKLISAKSISDGIKLLLTPKANGDIDYEGAEAFYNTYKDQMKGTLYMAEANELLGKAGNAKQALAGADQIWSEMGPKGGYNAAVDIFKMRERANKLFADKPLVLKMVIEELNSKKSAFDGSQSESNAALTNSVMSIYMKTKDINKVISSPAFNALPAGVQFDITNHMENHKWVQEGRTLEEQQRRERVLELETGGVYLDYSNPDKLRNMSRAQVEALLPTLGFNRTNHLVAQWDQLQNKDYLLTSQMDTTQFKDIATEYGYKAASNPSGASQNEKDRLGDLKARIDLLIEKEAKDTHKPVSKERKTEIMRDAMNNQAKVDSGAWYKANPSMPLATMSEAEIKKIDWSTVVVPQTERTKIVEALETKYKQTQDPRYKPTEDNIKTLFVMNKSPAARKLYGNKDNGTK